MCGKDRVPVGSESATKSLGELRESLNESTGET